MALSELARNVRRRRLTYLTEPKFERLEAGLQGALAAGAQGGIAEFGVALGGSAIVLATQAVAAGQPFHGFDVFAMIPPPTSEKDSPKSRDRFKIIESGKSPGIGSDTYYGYIDNLFDKVCRSFQEFGVEVGKREVYLHKGLFQDVVPDIHLDRLAFVHIDCDFYEAVSYSLGVSWPLLSHRGCIIFDDYHTHGGCKAAVDEYFDGRSDFVINDGPNVKITKKSAA